MFLFLLWFCFQLQGTKLVKLGQARPGRARQSLPSLRSGLARQPRSFWRNPIYKQWNLRRGASATSGFQSYSDLSATGRPYCSAKSHLLPCHGCHSPNGGIRMDLGVNLTVLTSLQSLHNPSFDYLLTFPSPVSKRKPLPLSRGLPEPSTEGPCQNCRIPFWDCCQQKVDQK